MMYTEPRKELEDSRPMYPINFNYYHLGTAISNSLEDFEIVTEKTIKGFEIVTEKTTRRLSEGVKVWSEAAKNYNESFSSVTKDLVHAPLENFLKKWYYIPITIWWKTFAPPMFNAVGTFAYEAKKWTEKPRFGLLGLSACVPFLTMIETLANKVNERADNSYDKIILEYLEYLTHKEKA